MHNLETRKQFIHKLSQGQTLGQISKDLNVSFRTLQRWIHLFAPTVNEAETWARVQFQEQHGLTEFDILAQLATQRARFQAELDRREARREAARLAAEQESKTEPNTQPDASNPYAKISTLALHKCVMQSLNTSLRVLRSPELKLTQLMDAAYSGEQFYTHVFLDPNAEAKLIRQEAA